MIYGEPGARERTSQGGRAPRGRFAWPIVSAIQVRDRQPRTAMPRSDLREYPLTTPQSGLLLQSSKHERDPRQFNEPPIPCRCRRSPSRGYRRLRRRPEFRLPHSRPRTPRPRWGTGASRWPMPVRRSCECSTRWASTLRPGAGRGEGPGEFRSPWAVARWPGDSVAAWEFHSNRGVSVFDSEGNLGRILRFPTATTRTDITVLRTAAILTDHEVRSDRGRGLQTRHRLYEFRDAEGSVTASLGPYPASEMFERQRAGTDRVDGGPLQPVGNHRCVARPGRGHPETTSTRYARTGPMARCAAW